MVGYRVAKATEYLVVTGYGIPDIKLVKKAWILPGQSCCVFDVSPVNYTFKLQAMSAEKLAFLLPAVFTIGPRVDDEESLLKYAKLLSPHCRQSNDVVELVQGIIEGETRVLAASMTMEEIFKGTKEFKEKVFEKVQLELNQFGLLIYNANIKQLVDVPGHEYFSYLGQRIQNEAANQAKIDVSEAKMKGEIGAKLREGQTSQNAAKIDAETKVIALQRRAEARREEIKQEAELQIFQNAKQAEIAQANADLATKKAEFSQQSNLAEVESQKAVAIKEAELQKQVEVMKAFAQHEKFRAEFLTKASVDNEIKVLDAKTEVTKKQQLADAGLYVTDKAAEGNLIATTKETEAEANRKQKLADAGLYETEKAAQGNLIAKNKETEAEVYRRQKLADAALYETERAAEGKLIAMKKEAEGLIEINNARTVYLNNLLDSFGGSYVAIRDYMMIQNGVYQELAKINAGAVAGLKPNISVWTNGGQTLEGSGEGSNSAMKEIAGVYRMLPPLLKTVQEQTGMNPPSWLGTLADTKSLDNDS